MNVLEKATIDEEIISVHKKLSHARGTLRSGEVALRYMPPSPIVQARLQDLNSKSKTKIEFLEDKLKNLELLRNEKDWEIVFIQGQNDHDEIWNHKRPGPDFTNTARLPHSRKLDLIMYDAEVQDDNRNDDQSPSSLSRISYMLYQLVTMRKVYEDYKSHAERTDRLTINVPTWSRNYTVVKDQTPFIENTISYFESVLDHHAKSKLISDFDDIKSFRSDGITSTELRTIRITRGRLLIRIHGFEETGHTNSAQQNSTIGAHEIFVNARTCSPGHPHLFRTKMARRISHSDRGLHDEEVILDHENVDSRNMIEMLFCNKDGDDGESAPIGALWLPVIDIISYNLQDSQEEESSGDLRHRAYTEIDSWFAVTPAGKVHLTIEFTGYPRNLPPTSESGSNSPHHNGHDQHSYVGHVFNNKLFDHPMRCASCAQYCSAFSVMGQCENCKILCHYRCSISQSTNLCSILQATTYTPPCLNTTSPLSMDRPELKAKEYHHQWVPYFNVSTNWCSHCGYFLSLGQGNHEGANRRCAACEQTCHAQCQGFIPHQCGMYPRLSPIQFQ